MLFMIMISMMIMMIIYYSSLWPVIVYQHLLNRSTTKAHFEKGRRKGFTDKTKCFIFWSSFFTIILIRLRYQLSGVVLLIKLLPLSCQNCDNLFTQSSCFISIHCVSSKQRLTWIIFTLLFTFCLLSSSTINLFNQSIFTSNFILYHFSSSYSSSSSSVSFHFTQPYLHCNHDNNSHSFISFSYINRNLKCMIMWKLNQNWLQKWNVSYD